MLSNSNKILVVDDDLASSLLMEELLNPHFTGIMVADSGQEALNLFLRGHSFDLVFMDILMKDMDGLSATKAIKKISPQVPIVGYSAILNRDTKIKCTEAGITAFLSKPIKVQELENIISQFLNIEINIR
jgi:CheY-like chemotaxis protein